MALSPNTFDSRIGPKLVMVARTGTPMPSVPSDRNSTGKAVGVQLSPVSVARWVVLSPGAPGRDSPDRSPLTSAITTGTPAADNCSAMHLQRLRLAGARGARDQTVPVHGGQRDPHQRGRVDDTVHDDGAQLQRLPFDGITSGDLLRGGGGRFVVMRPTLLAERPIRAGMGWAAAVGPCEYC